MTTLVGQSISKKGKTKPDRPLDGGHEAPLAPIQNLEISRPNALKASVLILFNNSSKYCATSTHTS